MAIPDPLRTADIRRVIGAFLLARLNIKLEKIKAEEGESCDVTEMRNALHERFAANAWIGSAASRASHIQVVTHSIKPIHSQAKGGTNLYRPPMDMPPHSIVGSHALGVDFEADTAVADAKHLDVSAFLSLPFEGRSLLDLMLAGDVDLPAALSDDAERAAAWIEAFTSITKPQGKAYSHTFAKQLYWLTGGDSIVDSNYHLLAPLFAASLTHRVYKSIYADRFDEASKNAREARKKNEFTDHVLHDYPNLAVQKLGGNNPQNISQLNSERRGDNYLLASLPPRWRAVALRPLLNTESMFHEFERRPDVKHGVKTLLAFLKSDPAASATTRARRDALITDLVGELLMFGSELRTLPAGWTKSPDCRLGAAERQWLDLDGLTSAAEQVDQTLPSTISEQISQAFGRWLNRKLRDPLPMGDTEYLHWCALAQTELDAEEWEPNHAT